MGKSKPKEQPEQPEKEPEQAPASEVRPGPGRAMWSAAETGDGKGWGVWREGQSAGTPLVLVKGADAAPIADSVDLEMGAARLAAETAAVAANRVEVEAINSAAWAREQVPGGFMRVPSEAECKIIRISLAKYRAETQKVAKKLREEMGHPSLAQALDNEAQDILERLIPMFSDQIPLGFEPKEQRDLPLGPGDPPASEAGEEPEPETPGDGTPE